MYPYEICGLKHANGNMAAMRFATKQFWFSDIITDYYPRHAPRNHVLKLARLIFLPLCVCVALTLLGNTFRN